jgi:hypothetical protein
LNGCIERGQGIGLVVAAMRWTWPQGKMRVEFTAGVVDRDARYKK